MTKKFHLIILHVVILAVSGSMTTMAFAKTPMNYQAATQCEVTPDQFANYIKSIGTEKWLAKVQAQLPQTPMDWTDLSSVASCHRQQYHRDLSHPPIQSLPFRPKDISRSAKPWIKDQQLQQSLDRLTQSDLTRNKNLKLYQNGSSQQAIKTIISEAQQFLFVNLLAMACDEGSEEIITLIEKKANEGVDVRININQTYSIANLGCVRRLRKSGVAIHKSTTHSSYYVNDRKQLLIGSQSLAKMFLWADGFNELDRDVMLYLEGPAATDAWRDFLQLWGPSQEKLTDGDLQNIISVALRSEVEQKLRGVSRIEGSGPSQGLCRFLTQKPNGQSRGIQRGLTQLSERAEHKILFSGVKFSYSKPETKTPNASNVIQILAARSNQGVSVNYIGNGLGGGNGELTMALRELAESATKKGWITVARWIAQLNRWDALRTTKGHFETYYQFLMKSKATVWTYFQFLHYKVWNFDDEALFIGSSNLTDDSFERFHETGVMCFDRTLIKEWNQALDLDLLNSTPYGAASFTASPPTK